jgi:diguanylate cyclase (GGDEF)-like protein
MPIRHTQLNTGAATLLNRAEFSQTVLAAAQELPAETRLAVLFFDLDRFSTVNKALGHELGYQALEVIASRLQQSFEDAAAIAHLGNDEFAVLVHDIDDAHLRVAAHQALRQVRDQINLPQQKLLLTGSAGISTYPDRAGDAYALIDQAMTAVAAAKRGGGNTCCFYDAKQQKQQLQRFNLELDLRYALAQSEISVDYQAKADTKTGLINGVEALARWKHPEMGWIAPQEFISIAEDSGLIAAIGGKVLEFACEQGKRWLDETGDIFTQRGFQLAVNLSAYQIEQGHLVKTVEKILRRTGFPPQHLTLEITESLFIDTHDQTIDKISQLRAMGIRIAIDDFGTGYSSLSLLKKFPADELKIDRQFITEVCASSVDATITRAVIDIAHALSLKVVAEGVENDQQLKFLREAGCDTVQGYLISRPLPGDQVPDLL